MLSKSTSFTLVLLFVFSINLTAQDDCEFVRSLKWSTYQGGNGEDEVMDLYVDPNTKYIYTVSRTNSTNLFPTNGDLGDGTQDKTYIQCTEHNGTLIWSTLISGLENPYSIRTNDVGEVILLGVTENPVMPGPANVPGSDKVLSGVSDLIFLKLDQNGSSVVASEFIGGNGYDYFSEDLTNFSFHDNKIYSVFTTTSTDLGVSSNSLLNTPGETYIFTYDTDSYSYDYQSYYEFSGSDAITVGDDGHTYLLLRNKGADMSYTDQYITPNALVPSYDEYGYSFYPLLIILDANHNQIYGSYFRVWVSVRRTTPLVFQTLHDKAAARIIY